MNRSSQPRSGIPRFKIARGTLLNFRSLVLKLIFGITIWMGGFVALVATLGPKMKGFIAFGPLGLVAMVALLIVYLNLPGRLFVGADGVLVDWRGSYKYIAFSEIQDALPYAEDIMGKRMIGVELTLRVGPPVKVPIGEDQFGADKRVLELSSAIQAALEVFRRAAPAEDAGFLRRGDRSMKDWVARLQSLGEGANAGPREAPIPVDKLWRIVEDPHAAEPERAGAAVALAGVVDGAGKERLRIAAESTVAPRLRIALDAAASGDEEAATEALREAESATANAPK